MLKKKQKCPLLMNKIIQRGLVENGRLKPEIQLLFDRLGVRVVKLICQNGEPFTQSGDQVLISGPQPIMEALLKIFPKGFIHKQHCQWED